MCASILWGSCQCKSLTTNTAEQSVWRNVLSGLENRRSERPTPIRSWGEQHTSKLSITAVNQHSYSRYPAAIIYQSDTQHTFRVPKWSDWDNNDLWKKIIDYYQRNVAAFWMEVNWSWGFLEPTSTVASQPITVNELPSFSSIHCHASYIVLSHNHILSLSYIYFLQTAYIFFLHTNILYNIKCTHWIYVHENKMCDCISGTMCMRIEMCACKSENNLIWEWKYRLCKSRGPLVLCLQYFPVFSVSLQQD